ncbi:MAG TPA: ABC transporter permease [Clostridia bacterium]|jgi:oligopeptide transport system permease protein|nr:ABC transporter permease [Clostridia bacterium]
MKKTEAQPKKVSLRLNPLSMHVNPDLFVPASEEEKQELVVIREGTSLWKDAMRRFRKNKFAMVALGLIIILVLFAFVGPLLSQYDYDQFNPGQEDQAPNWAHPFGTDRFGRDLLVRNMYGARISLSIGIIAAALTLVIGSLYGSVSGFVGGRTDNIMMRVIDVIYSLPDLLVVILLSATLKEPLEKILESSVAFSGISELGPAFFSMLIVFALMYWGTMARIVRGEVLRIKEQEYVLAARALGASSGRIIRRHVLPNCIGPIIVTTTLQIPSAIFTESFLSFIGLGISAPLASLGSMVTDALQGVYSYPSRVVFPSVIIALIILAFNTVGDALRDVLDPRMKK